MALIFLMSATPDLIITQLFDYFDTPHHYLIDLHKINWHLVWSTNNPFFHLPTIFNADFWLHKVGHCIVYSVLGILCYRWTRRVLPSFWICFAYACFDELHQAFTPGRSSRWTDVVLDSVMALLFIWLYHRLQKPKRS
nr:VanZ family protein [Tumebacillus amylolyticus]